MKILLIGPPGVGKGTQSKLVCEFFSVEHISTGDILRKHVYDCTGIGKFISRSDLNEGKFVQDDTINNLVYKMKEEGILTSSYLLDGYPRTMNQALFCVTNILRDSKYIVIYLNSDKADILNRILRRRVCINCGTVYNLENFVPKSQGVCDRCGGNLIHRSDDTKKVFHNRLKIYYEMTSGIIEYFRSLNVLYEIKASGSVEDVFNNIKDVVGEYYDLYKK